MLTTQKRRASARRFLYRTLISASLKTKKKRLGNYFPKPILVGMQHSPKAKQDLVCHRHTSKTGIWAKREKTFDHCVTNVPWWSEWQGNYASLRDTCGMWTCIRYANSFKLAHQAKKQPNHKGLVAFLVGMQHSPKAKQDLVCRRHTSKTGIWPKRKKDVWS